MARLTLREFLETYPADRKFVLAAGQVTTVGDLLKTFDESTLSEEVTHRGNELGVVVFLGGRETGRIGYACYSQEEPSPVYQEDPEYTKARLWAMEFSDKVNGVETCYHAWQIARDIAKTFKGTDSKGQPRTEYKETLRARANELQGKYNAARAILYAWVVAHPAPKEADKLI